MSSIDLEDPNQIDDPTDASAGSVGRLGIASFLLGGLVLPAASFTLLRYPAMALAVVGAGLGILGLIKAWKDEGRFLFPAVGLGACLMGLLLAVWAGPAQPPPRAIDMDEDATRVAPLLGSTPTQQNVTTQTSTWVNASKSAVVKGSVRVRVLDAVVGPVPVTNRGGEQRWLRERGLIVRLRLSNVGMAGPVQYLSWASPAKPADGPALVDHLGQVYPTRRFGPDWTVKGQASRAWLAPGKWADDVLVFAPPAVTVTFLHLSLPASAFGGKGTLQMELPRSMIVFR
jgi:hypothetical protein